MKLYGTIFAMPKTLAISAKDFGDLSERLWKTLRKTFANAAKDFRTPMFIPRSANICTMENHGLYHSRPTKVCTLSDKNHVVYDPKLPYLHPETMALLMPKPHGLGCQTLQFFFLTPNW